MTDEKSNDLAEETEAEDSVEAEASPSDQELAPGDESAVPAADEDEFVWVKAPEFDIDYKGDCAYEVKVTVPAANSKKQTEELFSEIIKEAQVPGFRKGKAPRGLVENKFGKVVRAESLEKLVGASLQRLVKDEDLHPLATPDIEGLEDAVDRKADEDIVFTLKFEVYPKCELGTYQGIDIEQPVLKVEDADVDKALLELRGRFATYEIADDAEATDGDQVVIDFDGKIDGETFVGGTAQNYPYILGSKRFYTEFEKALQGAKAGSEVVCDVVFPEDYSNKVVAGKTANFTINVNEVKRKTTPEIDDDFAKQAGFETALAMREQVANDLRASASSYSRVIGERQALRKIIEGSTFEIPATIIESSTREYYEQERRRLIELRAPYTEIEAREAELLEEARKKALLNLKSFVAVNEIGEAENIQVTEDDFLKEAEAIQKRTGADMDVVSRFLSQQDQRNEYIGRIFRQKTMEVIWNSAKISQKEVSRQELEAQYEAMEEI